MDSIAEEDCAENVMDTIQDGFAIFTGPITGLTVISSGDIQRKASSTRTLSKRLVGALDEKE